jgi:hypothetical protein
MHITKKRSAMGRRIANADMLIKNKFVEVMDIRSIRNMHNISTINYTSTRDANTIMRMKLQMSTILIFKM